MVCLCAAASLDAENHRKLARDLRTIALEGVDKNETVDVIVQFSSSLSESHHAKVRQQGAA
jgi:hypothetical protein